MAVVLLANSIRFEKMFVDYIQGSHNILASLGTNSA